jgi:lipoate-protein ligase A
MLCINDHCTDPYFNLAAEEYVLKNFTDNCFMLWRNAPSVIVGRHQNSLAEINVDYVKGANIAGFLKVASAMLDQGVV